jgi:hypothetical protein
MIILHGGAMAEVPMLELARQEVDALPNKTLDDQAKRAVLEIALERAKASADAGMQRNADALLHDVKAVMGVSSAAMSRQATTDSSHIAAIKPVPVAKNNPYLEALAAWGNDKIAMSENPWPRATLKEVVMKGLATREVGEEIRNCVWLYSNPASPLRGNGEILKRLLRRCHAFIDAANLNASPATTAITGIYDQFATESGISGLVEFISLYPGLLLPSQRAEWDSGLQAAFDKIWSEAKRADNWNLNIETARMVAMLHLGYYYNRQEVIDKVLRHVDGTLSKMKPDGAFPYNGDSNPSCNYHGAIIGSLSKIYDISGYEPLAKALTATQWKGPVMGRTDEFWTSPFHKTFRWNYERGTENANQLVITLSKNPYANFLRGKSGGPFRDSIAWYRPDLPTKPMPDSYTIIDRNVKGPRAWYGRFNYAATYHSKSPDENATGGHETLMGCMTVDDPDGRVNSILVNAAPRVKVTKENLKDARGNIQSTAWAQLTAGLKGAYLTGRNYSASAATYSLTTTRGYAYQGKTTDWQGRQVWLGLPDRIIGLLSTVPTKAGAEAFEINTVLRLISGGTAGAAICKKLEKTGENRYCYGELDIIVHHSNFTALTADIIPYRRRNFPASELTLRATKPNADHPQTYPDSTEFLCCVEVRPIWAKGDAKVVTSSENGLLKVHALLDGKRWHVIFNASDKAVTVNLPANTGPPIRTSLRISDLQQGLPSAQIRRAFDLAPAQEAVLIESEDPVDHRPGWDSFEAMVSSH